MATSRVSFGVPGSAPFERPDQKELTPSPAKKPRDQQAEVGHHQQDLHQLESVLE